VALIRDGRRKPDLVKVRYMDKGVVIAPPDRTPWSRSVAPTVEAVGAPTLTLIKDTAHETVPVADDAVARVLKAIETVTEPVAQKDRRGTLYDDPKSRRRRVVPMPALCIAPLRWHRLRHREAFARTGVAWSEKGHVFTTRNGRSVEPRNVYQSFTRLAADAGLRVVRLHDARHGCATLLTAAGVAPRIIMEILGHSQSAS